MRQLDGQWALSEPRSPGQRVRDYRAEDKGCSMWTGSMGVMMRGEGQGKRECRGTECTGHGMRSLNWLQMDSKRREGMDDGLCWGDAAEEG